MKGLGGENGGCPKWDTGTGYREAIGCHCEGREMKVVGAMVCVMRNEPMPDVEIDWGAWEIENIMDSARR